MLGSLRLELVGAAAAEDSGDVVRCTAVDLSGAGAVVFVQKVATASESNRAFLEGSNTSASSGFAELAGSEVVPSANGQFLAVAVKESRHRWVRLAVDRTVATALGECVAIVGGLVKLPGSSGSDFDALELVAPAEVQT